jgi:mannosyl-3-phosphoglycerate phosphatase
MGTGHLVSRGALAPLLVATDLDGCLLCHSTYRWAPARPALEALAAHGGRLVLASSKTRGEMEALAAELPLVPALIVENGGALLVPYGHLAARPPEAEDDAPWWRFSLGTPHAALVAALDEIAGEAGARVRGFAGMDPEEVARLTDLSLEEAARALRREYDEPFVVESGEVGLLAAAAARRGLRVSRGGRLHHLTGETDKGSALARLLALYAAEGQRYRTVGMGDAPNDIPLLRIVQYPLLMPGPDGRVDPDVHAALPLAGLVSTPGPRGWDQAVREALEGGETA